MTKAELLQENKKLKEEIDALEAELISLNEAYCETEKQFVFKASENNSITNIDDFIFRLKSENLKGWDAYDFENFIRNYIKFYEK